MTLFEGFVILNVEAKRLRSRSKANQPTNPTMNYTKSTTKSTTNKQTTMTKLMRWEHFRKQGIAVLYVFENNDWIKYTESKFYTTDELIAWVVPNSKGFATAQVLLKNGYTEVQAKIHS